MEIREALDEKEHYYSDMGEEICCPLCGTLWMEHVEGDVTFGACDHLRFSLHSECDNDFEFFGDWDTKGFVDMVDEAVSKNDDIHIHDVLRAIQHPDVNKAIVYVWKEDPLNRPWMLWDIVDDVMPMNRE